MLVGMGHCLLKFYISPIFLHFFLENLNIHPCTLHSINYRGHFSVIKTVTVTDASTSNLVVSLIEL
jgi:hypothetical protein